MIYFTQVAKTQVDWDVLLSYFNQLINRSLTRGLDANRQAVGGPSSFIVALGEIERENSNPNQTLREAGALLRHFSYSFLIAGPRESIIEILSKTDLKFTYTSTPEGLICGILSGNLEQWRTSIINCCSDRQSKLIRKFFDELLVHFEQEGLSQLWVEYGKRSLADKTFFLEHK